MSMLRGLPGNMTIEIQAQLRRGQRTETIQCAGIRWDRDRDIKSRHGRYTKGRALSAELWVRSTGAGISELRCTTTADVRQLDALRFDVHIPVRTEKRVSWPFVGGAFIPIDRLAARGKPLELTYPVYASMQWVDVFGDGQGVYVGAHDDVPYFKHFQVAAFRKGRRREVIVSIIFTDLAWSEGKVWDCPPIVVASHEGGWQSGAKIYRAWADTWFRHDDKPEFLRRSPGHNMVSFPTDGGRVQFKDLTGLAIDTRKLGIDGLHVADWMQPSFDAWYPDYTPDKRLGGEAGLRHAIELARDEGLWTCLYTNGRLMDPESPVGEHIFEWAAKLPKHVQRRFKAMWKRTQDPSYPGWDPSKAVPKTPSPFNLDGTAAEEWWGRVLSPMCPSVPGWQELWLSRVERLVRTTSPHMLQVDQVCGCWGMPCYDETHPHTSPALAWSAYRAFMGEMRRRLKAVNPEICFWSEGVNDMLGQPFDGLQPNIGFESLLAGIGEWDPRLFKYTFPEYALVVGDINGKRLAPLHWALMVGAHAHYYLPKPAHLGPEPKRNVRFVARMRAKYWKAFTSNDVFVPIVESEQSVKAFGYRDGSQMLIVAAPLRGTDDVDDDAYEAVIGAPGGQVELKQALWMRGRSAGRATPGHSRCMLAGKGACVLEFRLKSS